MANRSQTQARDIFDLYLLLEKNQNKIIQIDKDTLAKAKDNIGLIHYDDYKSQVVAYLLSEYQEQFGASDMWKSIAQAVCEALESSNETH